MTQQNLLAVFLEGASAIDSGGWIVSAFLLWILIGFAGLFLFWRIWHNMGRYFSEMEDTPWAVRSALGWPSENPIPPVLGPGRDIARRRLLFRLAIWGAPPQLKHSDAALKALRAYRVLYWCVQMLFWLVVLVLSVLLTPAFYLIIVFSIALPLLVLRPAKWPKVTP
ncbi:hypothetical protein K3552_03245 [Leisingera aquaemixtae]|uniref:hypothetical protein n=1 Tax=Leisingera aquaemixtae TaxID=1396826 RepID=UPI0021A77E42|nr:hypothetical protein [Leisingera aquaemixtae]UWQ38040.1 hypothetical protein K3552_03245 [Leisingera aquaemixtae]